MTFDPLASQISWEIDFSPDSEVSRAPQFPAGAGPQFGERFQVEGLLGEGGTGSVYLAEELGVGRKVAIKVLKDTVTDRQRQRFVAEGELAAALKHPGIVRVYGAGRAGDHDFLVYEWVEGGRPLAAVFEGLTSEERLELLVQVCDATGAAHTAGVVHRDLKSENVLVDPGGRVRVVDFGIGHARDADRLTRTGEFVGTPLYMAPERFGSLVEITPALDVWSIGVMIHLALTDAYPFEAPTLLQLVAAFAKPIPEHAEVPKSLAGVMAVCRRCLNRAPGQRYLDANSLGADLRLALSGSRKEARPRSWTRLAGATVILAALALGLVRVSRAPEALSAESAARLLAEAPASAWAEAWHEKRFASLEAREELALAYLESDQPLQERIEFGLLVLQAEGATYQPRLALARLYAEASLPGPGLDMILRARVERAPDSELIPILIDLASRGRDLAVLDLLLEQESWKPRDWAANVVLGLVEVDARLGAAALERVARGLGRDPLIVLRARVSAASGGDARLELESALRRTNAEAIRLELALTHLQHGDRASAQEVLGTSKTGEASARSEFVEDPDLNAPLRWRSAMTKTLWAEAQLELALGSQSGSQSGSLPLSERRARVLALAASLRALEVNSLEVALLEAWATQAPPSSPPSSRLPEWALRLQADLLLQAGRAAEVQAGALPALSRGRVLLAQGRPLEAFEVLNPLTKRRELPTLPEALACLDSAQVVRPNDLPRLTRLVASLRGELAQEAAPALLSLQKRRQSGWKSARDEDAAIERVLTLDPANVEALLHHVRALYSRGEAGGEELCFMLSSRYPITITKLHKIALAPALRLPAARGHTARLFRRVHRLEIRSEPQGDPAGLVPELDRLLNSKPAFHWARVLRAFTAIRAGRLARAKRDLEVVLEVEPACAQAHFYQALLAGARRAPRQVLAHFSEALELGYQRESGWLPKRYPELSPYLDRPGFERLSTR